MQITLNMFSPRDVGRFIIIKNCNGASYIKKNVTYQIRNVLRDNMVSLHGVSTAWQAEEDHYEFVEEKKGFPIEVGDIIIIKDNTTTLKKGEEKQVKGFVDGNKDKVVVEGIIPGGWIKSHNLSKKIDPSKYRVKTVLECMYHHGIFSPIEMIAGQIVLLTVFGKPLSNINVQQVGDHLFMGANKDYLLNSNLLEDINKPVGNYDILLSNKVSSFHLKSTRTKTVRSVQDLIGKSIFQVTDKVNTDDDILQMLLDIYNGGKFSIGSDYYIEGNALQIVDKKEDPQMSLPLSTGSQEKANEGSPVSTLG